MKNVCIILVLAIASLTFFSCKEKTPAEKIKEKMEHAGEDVKDAAEEAGDATEDKVEEISK
jgi:hypothetical protein